MKILDGYKSYIGAALAVVVGVLQSLGYITDEAAKSGYVIATGIFGAGMAGKLQKLSDSVRDAIKTGGILVLAVGLSWLSLGCASDGSGPQFSREKCATLDLATYAEGFVCSQVPGLSKTGNEERDTLICHHSMLAGYHTAQAICIGLTPNPAETP